MQSVHWGKVQETMEKNESSLSNLIPRTYVVQGLQSLRSRDHYLSVLITHQRMLPDPLDDATIEYILCELSRMDSNNFHEQTGVGEREGRVFSGLVMRRHWGLSHGIGRSGDIAEVFVYSFLY